MYGDDLNTEAGAWSMKEIINLASLEFKKSTMQKAFSREWRDRP